MLTINE